MRWRGLPKSRSAFRRAAWLVALTVLPAMTAGHERSTSYSTWDIRGQTAQVTVRLLALDLTRFPWNTASGAEADAALGRYLTESLQLLANGEPCAVTDGPRRLRASAGQVAVEWRVTCAHDAALRLRSDLLLDVAPSHLHFARVRLDGEPDLERVLTVRQRQWDLMRPAVGPRADRAGTPVGGYVRLGVEHIITGYDHVAFVLALVLLSASLREVATVVTGFTVAHSITLALAVLGHIRPEAAPVEALIGLSIALVAAENLWLAGGRTWTVPTLITAMLGLAALLAPGAVPVLTLAGLALFCACYFGLLRRIQSRGALRWTIAFIFGLVHGFGFAGVLAEAKLPTDRMAHALFGFNVGVELGQLAVVAAIWPVLRLVARTDVTTYRWCVDLGSGAIAGLGVFWFVSRAYS